MPYRSRSIRYLPELDAPSGVSVVTHTILNLAVPFRTYQRRMARRRGWSVRDQHEGQGAVTWVDPTRADIWVAMARDDYRRELGDGLVLRWSSPDDVERVATLNGQVFRQSADAPPNQSAPIWTRDMFSGRHPYIGPRDFAVVEDACTGALVASTCLIAYPSTYEGIPFQLGRPELVGSLPEYRRRGLIRAIFDLIHAKSEARGHLVQGITGIPYYYRQFGYEYAALLDEGINVYFPAIPALKPDATEPYTLREVMVDDAPLLADLWAHTSAWGTLWTPITEDYWRWTLVGMHPGAMERWRVYLIVDAADHASGPVTGALMFYPGRRTATITVNGLVVEPGTPLVRVMPSVLRGVLALAETVRPTRPDTPPAGAINIRHGGPGLRAALGDTPFVEAWSPPYAWYLRVADLPGFLRHIAPALERRLAESPHAGYSGELTLDFYRGGLRLVLEAGKLTSIEEWQRPLWGEAKAGFPPLVFLQALFGHRTLYELRAIYPDVWAEGDAKPLLEALFPKLPSLLVPLD